MRRVDPQKFLEEAAEAVVGDVQREQPRRPDPESPADEDQQPGADRVVDELVEEGRVVGVRALVLERDVALVSDVDLQAPREAGRLAVELLVEVVAPTADPLCEQETRRDSVREAGDARTGAMDDPRPDQTAEEDSAPDAEPAAPDGKRPPPLLRYLVPTRDVVVGAGADDAGRDTPDGYPQDEVGVAAHPLPAHPGQPDARDYREQQHQTVQVDRPAEDVEDAAVRRGDRCEKHRHRRDILPTPANACLVRGVKAGCRGRPAAGSPARSGRSRGAGRRRAAPRSAPPRDGSSPRRRAVPPPTARSARAPCRTQVESPPQPYKKIRRSAQIGCPLSGGL